MLTKTLQTLIERTERKGQAVKRVQEGAVMGNCYGDREWVKTTPLIDQWRVTVSNFNETMGDWKVYDVDHYGTGIATITVSQGKARLVSWYGESNSDRDALNGLCGYFGIDAGFRYRPSIGKFEMIGGETA